MIDFSNRIKKEMTEGIVRALLEDAGYRVVDTGIERVLREVSVLSAQQYEQLNLPDAMRWLADMTVMDRDQREKVLVEVKYRSDWDGSLLREMSQQVLHLRELVLVTINAQPSNPQEKERLPSRFLRCCRLRHLAGQYEIEVGLREAEGGGTAWVGVETVCASPHLWWKLRPLQDVYSQINHCMHRKTLLLAIEALAGVLND